MKFKNFEIVKKSGFWNILPFLRDHTAQALFGKIYVPPRIYRQMKANQVDDRTLIILSHEVKHLHRQKEAGPLKWYLKYIFSRKFRLQEELLGVKESMKIAKQKGIKFDIEKSARALSSWTYLRMISRKKAFGKLSKFWHSV